MGWLMDCVKSFAKSALSRALFLFLFLFLFSGCQLEKLVTLNGRTMGTTYSVKYTQTENQYSAKEIQEKIDQLLVDVNKEMSTYIPDSEISLLNKSKVPMKISPGFADVLQFSLDLAQKTGGSFDPTVGPLVNLWGFGPFGMKRVPSKEQVKAALVITGSDKVQLKKGAEGYLVTKSHEKVYVDLSATAKGYGVDKVSELLTSMGFKNHLVEIGGEMRARGKKKGQPWRIAIESPSENQRSIQRILKLQDLAIATSGNYRNFFVEKGRRFSHTINPKTGQPYQHRLASVSVLSSTCLESDGLATALMTMGPEKAWQYAVDNKLAAYLIIKKEDHKQKDQNTTAFLIKSTPRFEEVLKKSGN